jgi:hypothetical protein
VIESRIRLFAELFPKTLLCETGLDTTWAGSLSPRPRSDTMQAGSSRSPDHRRMWNRRLDCQRVRLPVGSSLLGEDPTVP